MVTYRAVYSASELIHDVLLDHISLAGNHDVINVTDGHGTLVSTDSESA